MSAVTLLCADHPLPLYDAGTRRTEASTHGGYTVSAERTGFAVRTHAYFRPAVEELDLDLGPYQYELDLRATEEDAEELRAYLGRNCLPGETVELWQLWVGIDREERVPHFRGKLADLDGETLAQLHPPLSWSTPWQCRMTIEI